MRLLIVGGMLAAVFSGVAASTAAAQAPSNPQILAQIQALQASVNALQASIKALQGTVNDVAADVEANTSKVRATPAIFLSQTYQIFVTNVSNVPRNAKIELIQQNSGAIVTENASLGPLATNAYGGPLTAGTWYNLKITVLDDDGSKEDVRAILQKDAGGPAEAVAD
jgi:hypothetical protein